MKFLYVILILVFFSCNNEEKTMPKNSSPEYITYEEYSGEEPNIPKETEVYVPVPPVVSVNESNGIPSDAITLFNNDNLDEWVSVNDKSKIVDWAINADSSFVIKSKTGNIRTVKEFGDIQLHLEWKSPIDNVSNTGQEVDSGVFLQGRYEIQILDNTTNTNFTNGFVASVYKQQIPLAKATMPMGKWNIFDIIYHAPEFDKRGHKTKSATITLLHNGVLVQDNAEIKGTTRFIGWPKNEAHGKAPIILQNHNDSREVSFRNIWVRELN